MRRTEQLRRLLKDAVAEKKIIALPGCHDVLTARIAEKVGFPAVYMTGYGTSASMLGQPDVGLLTLSEMAMRAGHMASAVSVPVLADGDTGYGNAVNVIRTVREYEKAGVAGIQLEDQVLPKKCGHMLGREIVPTDEMVGKIRAAVDARSDPDFVIMARTDARTKYGIEEALARAQAYEEAGADILFVESPESEEEMRRITGSFKVPVLANMIEHGRTPFKSVGELQALGYHLALYCVSSTFIAAKAVQDLMQALMETGTTKALWSRMMTFEAFNTFVGLPEIRQLENKYIPRR
ncbi:MAG: oxaloacetate decarboxylase [Candidatus Methylomirabilales bacterium]